MEWCGVSRQRLALIWDDIILEFKNLVIEVTLNPSYEGKLALNEMASQHGYPCWADVEYE